MVQFPETAESEWKVVAEAAHAHEAFAERLKHEARLETELENQRLRQQAKTLLQAELEAEQTPALEMMTLADYQNTPTLAAPVDLIEGVLKDNSLCLVLGPSGAGKSTVAMQMIHSLQTGDDWMGQPVKPITGAFGIMSYDMDAGMLAATLVKYPNVDLHKVALVNAHKRGNPLGVPDMRAKIAKTWQAMGVEVVIIDSFSASFFGQDQNDAASTMSHYRDLGTFALTEVGARALVVIVHSTESNPEKVRGSTVHHDVADSIVAVSKTDESDPNSPRKVRMVKYRAAPGQTQMAPVMVGTPDPTTHLIGIDTGAMTMSGMNLPPTIAAQVAFPETHEDADTTEADDDLWTEGEQ